MTVKKKFLNIWYWEQIRWNRNVSVAEKNKQIRRHVQGATAHNSMEWFVFTVFCFVTTFAIVPEVSITLVMQ